MTELEQENLNSRVAIVEKTVAKLALLTPDQIDDVVIKLQKLTDIEITNEKYDTANSLTIALVVIFASILLFSYGSVTAVITMGYAEHIDKLEKLNFVTIGAGLTFMGGIVGYYYNNSDAKQKK